MIQEICERPWLSEPNHIEFEYDGFPCVIHRNTMGSLCGYVGLSRGHRYWKVDYRQIEDSIDVHGGLTFSDEGQIYDELPEGKYDDTWWFGFDCAHYSDIMPEHDDPESELQKLIRSRAETDFMIKKLLELKSMRPDIDGRKATYKTVSFVEEEIIKLVKQLKDQS